MPVGGVSDILSTVSRSLRIDGDTGGIQAVEEDTFAAETFSPVGVVLLLFVRNFARLAGAPLEL